MPTEWLNELADRLLEAADWLAWCQDPRGAALLGDAAQALFGYARSEHETQAELDAWVDVEEERPCPMSL